MLPPSWACAASHGQAMLLRTAFAKALHNSVGYFAASFVRETALPHPQGPLKNTFPDNSRLLCLPLHFLLMPSSATFARMVVGLKIRRCRSPGARARYLSVCKSIHDI